MNRIRRGAAKPAAVLPRLAIIVPLAAFAAYLWFGDPLRPESRRAAQYCAGVAPGTPVIAIMQAASAQGATGFRSPREDTLVVAFGKDHCTLALHAGASAGNAAD